MHAGLFDKRSVNSNEIGSLAFGLHNNINLHVGVTIVSTRSNKCTTFRSKFRTLKRVSTVVSFIPTIQ